MMLVSCNKGDDDPRLVIITFDGLRWQELFSGADESLVGDTRFVSNPTHAFCLEVRSAARLCHRQP